MTNPTTSPIATTVPLFDLPPDPPGEPFTLPVELVSVDRAVGFAAGPGGNCDGVPGMDELVGGDKGGGVEVEGGEIVVFDGGGGGGGECC